MPWRTDRFLNIEVLKHKWHIGREKKHRGKRKQSVSQSLYVGTGPPLHLPGPKQTQSWNVGLQQGSPEGRASLWSLESVGLGVKAGDMRAGSQEGTSGQVAKR